MSIIASTNYTAAGTAFDYATAGSDPIFKEHIQVLAKAFHDHTHESTRGANVRRIETASAPGSAGQVQISGDSFRWWGTGSSAIFTASSTNGTETLSNKTLSLPIIASFANANHNHSNSAGGGGIDGSAVTTTVTGTGNVVKATSPTIATPTITSPSIAGGTLSGVFSGGTFTGATLSSPSLTTPTIAGATLSGTISGGTLTGTTLTTPTIASFTNAQHDHSTSAQGGLISASAPVGQTLTDPKINDLSSTHTYNFAASELAANRQVTLPLLTANDVFVFADFAQTLQNKTLITPTIGNFTNATHNHTVASAGGTLDGGAIGTSVTGTGNVVKATSPSLTGPTIAGATLTGTIAGGTHTGTTLTTPTINGATMSGTISGGTYTGATLTTPSISSISNSGTITIPTGTDTLVGRATTDTLTNKTYSNPTLSGSVSGTPTWASAQQITLSTAAQPNITSLGSLSGLTVASGQLAIPVGSAVSPGLVFDAGNGLFSLGNDRLNFATGGTVRAEISASGSVGIATTPHTWHTDYQGLEIGTGGAIFGGRNTTPGIYLRENSYVDAAAVSRAIVTGTGSALSLVGGGLTVFTAPSVSSGSGQTFTTRLTVTDTSLAYVFGSSAGGLTIQAGATAVDTRLGASGSSGKMEVAATELVPFTNAFMNLGNASLRWSTIYAQNALNTSRSEYKENIASLDPDAALVVVLKTPIYTYNYKTTPDRPSVGFLADAADPLLSPDNEFADASTTVGVALAAIQALAAKVAALEGRLN